LYEERATEADHENQAPTNDLALLAGWQAAVQNLQGSRCKKIRESSMHWSHCSRRQRRPEKATGERSPTMGQGQSTQPQQQQYAEQGGAHYNTYDAAYLQTAHYVSPSSASSSHRGDPRVNVGGSIASPRRRGGGGSAQRTEQQQQRRWTATDPFSESETTQRMSASFPRSLTPPVGDDRAPRLSRSNTRATAGRTQSAQSSRTARLVRQTASPRHSFAVAGWMPYGGGRSQFLSPYFVSSA
jgi:hypothetical protein